MTTVLQLIKDVRATKGTKAKKALLAQHANSPLVRQFFWLTMEPLVNLYTTVVPEQAALTPTDNSAPLDEAAFMMAAGNLVSSLSKRDISKQAAVSAAFGELFINHPHNDARELIDMVIQRTTRTGLGEKSIVEVFGAGFITMLPYMRCTLPKDSNIDKWAVDEEGNWKTAKLSQIKADGEFANISIALGRVTVQTRNGRSFPLELDGAIHPAWAQLINELVYRTREMSATQYHGELLVKDANGKLLPRHTGNGIFNSLLNDGLEIPEGYTIVYHVWDCIPISEAVSGGTYNVPYVERFGVINRLFASGRFITPIETKIVWNREQANAHMRDALARGEEGTVLKDTEGPWMDGNNRDNVKNKIEFVCDLLLVGFNEGDQNGKHAKTFGSMLLQTAEGLLEVAATGITDKDREKLHNNREKYMGGVFKVTSNDITYATKEGEKHSLFLPRIDIASFRPDKAEADTFEQVQAQLAAARGA